nr:GNAT family N-acetyltransferase [Romeria gracilis]
MILREMGPADAEAIFRIFADDQVTQYTDMDSATQLSQVEWLIQRRTELFRQKKRIRWGIARKQDNVIIGSCGYTQWHQQSRRAEIGYELARAYWHQGIMTEAAKAVIDFGFQAMELNRIEAMVMLENQASMKLNEPVRFSLRKTCSSESLPFILRLAVSRAIWPSWAIFQTARSLISTDKFMSMKVTNRIGSSSNQPWLAIVPNKISACPSRL